MEVKEPLFDFNFPEMLAGDLSRSSDIFQSKHLTAGAPVPSLVDDGSQRRYSLQDSSITQLRPQSQDVLSRMKSLQTANQAYSELFFHSYDEPRRSSESSETTATASSGGMEPPSIGTRDVSITTTGTSVTSARFSSESAPTIAMPIDNKAPTDSWMDLEVDVPTMEGRSYSLGRMAAPPPLFQRPDLGDLRSMSMGAKVVRAEFLQSSPFRTFGSKTESPSSPKTFSFTKPSEIPSRRSSLNYNFQMFKLSDLHVIPRTPPSPQPQLAHNNTPSAVPSRTPPTPPARSKERDWRAELVRSAPPSEAESNMEDFQVSSPNGDALSFHVVSPLFNVEKWLESGLDEPLAQRPQSSGDVTSSGVPLSTEVLDTLRISVACFPETMLLCSSLSIETIRGHSRKVKYATSPSQVSLSLTEDAPKPSKWKWLTSKRVPDQQSSPKLQPRRSFTSVFHSSRPNSAQWAAIKNIFPSGTDYLCDALYAHLLAYNYITALCPRPVSVPLPTTRPPSSTSSSTDLTISRTRSSDGTKIPRKAASLLGLQNDPNEPISTPTSPSLCNSTMRHKGSFMMGRRAETSRTFTSAANRTPEAYDQSLRELRLGLAKCIARLVATLSLTADTPLVNTVKSIDGKEVDPLFMRALCEVVRCHEER
ncbi:uncharacterized protein BCR38DRAFT_483289 [Pseudomassariella vexata]|uniref:Uncharacterized protein n=1 Tax=Pseudomassariella vexata TaxID=1141098 RepID=A0A1Y2E8B9_9PEZI|nr:uncharacterized protein BCR38DRAFT_483289 [Pseudomassariella vexata]ORY67677.1 hypothetical protein BCR38DRAFT_483289 [Pseudomassariella vexata]